MDLRKITDSFYVSPQIAPGDVAEIAGRGFRSIICNRPDGEEPGQCRYGAVEAAARAAGLEFLCLPISSGAATAEAVAAFRGALDEMPGPVLAYCRSGTRCTMLWSMAQWARLAPEDILKATAEAGYDMSGLVRHLAAVAPAPDDGGPRG